MGEAVTSAVFRIPEVVTTDVMLNYDKIQSGRQLVQRGALELQPEGGSLSTTTTVVP
jgi:hypothetical protein